MTKNLILTHLPLVITKSFCCNDLVILSMLSSGDSLVSRKNIIIVNKFIYQYLSKIVQETLPDHKYLVKITTTKKMLHEVLKYLVDQEKEVTLYHDNYNDIIIAQFSKQITNQCNV